MNAVARRATLNQKRAGGTMVNAVPLHTVIPTETTLDDACDILFREQMDAYRRANVATAEILDDALRAKFHLKPCRGYVSVSTTFQPYFADGGDLPRFRFRRLPNGANTMPLYVSIMPLDQSGDLWVNYEYIVGYVDPVNIRKFHRFLLAFLAEIDHDPDRTIGELRDAARAGAAGMRIETPDDMPDPATETDAS
ncbi:hypothetical protein KIH77_02345 [Bifidobacterium sp. 82T24]|uniref:hypothetical protein n=1 Tax=Bifidobacterium pluvialisilvae TaxID=2834436 RepID=UPI001C5A4A5E|nr:hypothetical protein [Bifidobacterium pluvialisilvae]MBW3087581.1 hypothetical protein [Bifidobacterium pluvialisilvae]